MDQFRENSPEEHSSESLGDLVTLSLRGDLGQLIGVENQLNKAMTPELQNALKKYGNRMRITGVVNPKASAFWVHVDTKLLMQFSVGGIGGSEWVPQLLEALGKLENSEAENNVSETIEIPQGFERIQQSAAGKIYSSEQLKIARRTFTGEEEGIVDDSDFMDSKFQKRLKQYMGDSDGSITFDSVRSLDNKTEFRFTDANGEQWRVSQNPWYPDQYPNGVDFDARNSDATIWKQGAGNLVQLSFKTSDVFQKNGRVNFRELRRVMQEAEQNFASEQRDDANAREWDIGPEPIQFIGLYDGSDDVVVQGMVSDAKHFPEMMNTLKKNGKSRYNFVTLEHENHVSEARGNARTMMRNQIVRGYEKNMRRFYLYPVSHGAEGGFYFHNTESLSPKYLILSPDDLKGLFKEFDDCEFVLDAAACLGAGVGNMIENFQDVGGKDGRVVAMLQSKGHSSNYEGRLRGTESRGRNGSPVTRSTVRNIFFWKNIQKSDMGQAAWDSERMAKQVSPSDGEFWKSGSQGGTATKAID